MMMKMKEEKFKKWSSGNATVAYLREKNEHLQEMHKEELEMKRMQLEREGNLMKLMVNQQQQQQKQMQEFQAKQQSDLMLAIVTKLIACVAGV